MDLDRARLFARRDELRRVIYGTPGGDTAEAMTELAIVERQLAELDARDERERLARSARLERGAAAAAASVTSGTSEPSDASRPHWWRRPAIVGAGVLAVAAIGLGIAIAIGSSPNLGDSPRGLEVFDRGRDAVDAGPRAFVAVLGTEAVSTFRSIGHAVGHDVWVFRDDGDVCMIAQREQWSSWGANCVTETEFARRGIRQFITADEFGDQEPPVGLHPASAVELVWTERSTGVEWSIVPLTEASVDGVWVFVPAPVDDGPTPMTYDEWSSSGAVAR
ncbi:hypothetical protein [Agromyces subbeticus]|uniref:hypothetical protein n=1 Tax=Agromyces subbeticus TaxID=293890 RepID=UPI0003B3CC08|nr:hypothetical protein [Agromyces subbeticus]